MSSLFSDLKNIFYIILEIFNIFRFFAYFRNIEIFNIFRDFWYY